MLALKIKKTNEIDSLGKKIFLTDDTGNYSLDNIGGYGAPNRTRDQVAIYPIGYLNDSKGNKTSIKFEPSNPLTSTTWTALPTSDGYLSFYLTYANAEASPDPTTHAVGEIVYSISDSALYKTIYNSTTGINEFQLVTNINDLVAVYLSDVYEEFFIANFSLLKIALNQKKTDLLIDSENLSNKSTIALLQDAYDTVRGIIQGSFYQFKIGNKYESSRQLEFLSTNNYSELLD